MPARRVDVDTGYATGFTGVEFSLSLTTGTDDGRRDMRDIPPATARIADIYFVVELDAGRGIGRAIAERFAAGGAAVGLVARSRDEVDHAAAGITDRGGNALAVVANVPDHGQVPEAAGQVSSALGPIDVLVNDAGIDDPMAFVDSSLDRWDQTIRVNLYGAIQSLPPGRSRHGHWPSWGQHHQCPCGPRLPGRTLIVPLRRREGRPRPVDPGSGGRACPHGIRVNGVAPGFVDTRMAIGRGGVNELDTPWFRAAYIERRKIPLARAAAPDEIAGPVLFFASRDANNVTEEILVVDGRLSVRF